MKKIFVVLISAVMILSSAAASFAADTSSDEVAIILSDSGTTVDGSAISTSSNSAVYAANDIIYYEDRDTYESGNTYGEGTAEDKHSAKEAAKHTVIHITEPGTYRVSGSLSYGQIFVDLGEDASDQVTLILDNVDITCTVAPAIFFYNVYECCSSDTATATYDVNTSNAGAKVIIADDSVNNINGAYVAKIYKDNDEAKKLHKYDAAFYSRMTMEITGETKSNGILNINAENEGLDSELNLTINGGIINIQSGDDGINVNEDGVSVFTMNAGYLSISAHNGNEGDGIDSNGWNVINGGTVVSLSNPDSSDGGIDSDSGTYLNGGTVIGAGTMYDNIEATSAQNFMTLYFSADTDDLIVITDEDDNPLIAYDFPGGYSYLLCSSNLLTDGTYHVYSGGNITGSEYQGLYANITSYTGGTQMSHGGTGGGFGGGFGGGMNKPGENFPTDGSLPTDGTFPTDGNRPANGTFPTDGNRPTDGTFPTDGNRPTDGTFPTDGNRPTDGAFPTDGDQISTELSYDFILSASNRTFYNVSTANETTNTGVSGFTDVQAGDWFAEAVTFCKDNNIMNGTADTTFSPTTPVTREMFATIVYRLAGSPEVSSESGFTDVTDSNAYYYDAIVWASSEGIIEGVGDNSFGLGQALTREQLVTMLHRYETSLATGESTASPSPEISGYNDWAQVSDWAQDAFKWAVGDNIITGTSDVTLSPASSTKRSEIAVVLMRYCA